MPITAIPSQTTTEPPLADTEATFQRLAAVWRNDTLLLSSSQARENHPAYRQIIALGPAVVPFLLRDLEKNQTHWFGALKSITGADPVPESDAGNIGSMSAAWLGWAKERGLNW